MLKFSYVFSEIHVLHAGFVENQDQRREEKRERGNDFARYRLWELSLACTVYVRNG